MSQISFEVFPPRTPEGEERLAQTLAQLAPLEPSYVSVTCGAGGSATDATFGVIEGLRSRDDALPVAGHLTCVGRTRAETDAEIMRYWQAGVRHIVALRGDPPPGESYAAHPQGYAFAADLVAGLKRVAPFDISVAAYPEMHPQAVSRVGDLDNLKRKLDAGASRAITNFFFDTSVYLRFLDLCLAAGITAPIVPGIMPVTNVAGLRRMATMSGVGVPDWLGYMFEGLDDDPDTRRMVAAVVAAEQVRLLQANGVDEFHFYTLNRPDLSYAIAHMLGVRPAKEA
jgi:methylenetetrahydrofolate reductase (NADPH)